MINNKIEYYLNKEKIVTLLFIPVLILIIGIFLIIYLDNDGNNILYKIICIIVVIIFGYINIK